MVCSLCDTVNHFLWKSNKSIGAISLHPHNLIFLQSLRTEIDNHEPRIHLVCNNGQKLIDEGHEDALEFTQLIDDLLARWQQLKDAVENRRNKLLQSEKAQQVRSRSTHYCVQYCRS